MKYEQNEIRGLQISNLKNDTTYSDVLSKIFYGSIESIYLNDGTATVIFFSYLDLYLTVKDFQHNMYYPNFTPVVYPTKPNLRNAHLTGATRCIKIINESRNQQELNDLGKMFGHLEDVEIVGDDAILKFTELKFALKFMKKHFNDFNYKQKVSFVQDPCSSKKYLPNALLDPSFYSLNRTIYLGGIQPEISAEDIFNTIRGGEILSLKILREKKCAFVDFVNVHSANAFLAHALEIGCIVNKKLDNGQEMQFRLKVNRGAENLIPVNLCLILYSGATRVLLLGNPDNSIQKNDIYNDFSQFGEIELINFVRHKNSIFVNFCSVVEAINAFQHLKNNEKLRNKYKAMSFGKDRCASQSLEEIMKIIINKRSSQNSHEALIS